MATASEINLRGAERYLQKVHEARSVPETVEITPTEIVDVLIVLQQELEDWEPRSPAS